MVKKWIPLLFALSSIPAMAGLESVLYWGASKETPPDVYRPDSTDVNFKSENGAQLHGIYTPSRKTPSKGVIVFFHGNQGNAETHYRRAVNVAGDSYDHLIFDYQGYGKSEGEATQDNTVADGRAAIRWAHGKSPELPLFVYGHSLGGAIAMKSAAALKKEVPIAGVGVQGTFFSYEAAARAVLGKAHLSLIYSVAQIFFYNDQSPELDIPRLSPIPILVIHGEEDEVVPYSLGEKTYELANEPKAFCPVLGGKHADQVGSWAIERLESMRKNKEESPEF